MGFALLQDNSGVRIHYCHGQFIFLLQLSSDERSASLIPVVHIRVHDVIVDIGDTGHALGQRLLVPRAVPQDPDGEAVEGMRIVEHQLEQQDMIA